MDKIKNLLIVFFGITALIGLVGAVIPTTIQGESGVRPQDVNVVNSPTVQAQQSGHWTVQIGGQPTVGIANTTANPVWVRDVNDARQPFHESLVLNVDTNSTNESGFIFVPAGKRLVIEYASADALMPTDQRMKIFIRTILAGNPRDHFLLLSRQGGSSGFDIFIAGQEMRLYADPGTSVTIQAVRLAASGQSMSVKVTISGYFVDVP